MAGQPIATIGSMHVCPMCSGTVPHVGGPVMGPGMPGATINGQVIAVMGDMCTCVGPPDTIVQGCAGATINGKQIATVGCMTAHGGQITVGVPGATLGPAEPDTKATATMQLKEIPFPKISSLKKFQAAVVGKGADMDTAEKNIEQIKNEAEERELQPRIIRTEFVDYENEETANTGKLKRKIKMKVYTVDATDGESISVKLKRNNIVNKKGDKQEDEDVIELTGTVNGNMAIVEYEIPNYNENEE